MRMLFDIAIPASITTPIRDITFKVVPVRRRTRITPVIPGGSASKMIKGSRNDLNCATRIKYKSNTDRGRPTAKLRKDAFIESTLPLKVMSIPFEVEVPATIF